MSDGAGYGVGRALEEFPLRRDDTAPVTAEGGFCDDAGAALVSAMLRMKGGRAEVCTGLVLSSDLAARGRNSLCTPL